MIIRKVTCTSPTGRHELKQLDPPENGCWLECVICETKFHVIAEQQLEQILEHTDIPSQLIPPIETN